MKADLSLYDGMPDTTYLNAKSLSVIFNVTVKTIYDRVEKELIPPPDFENGRYTVGKSCAYNIHKKRKDRLKTTVRMPRRWKLGTLREFKIKLEQSGE